MRIWVQLTPDDDGWYIAEVPSMPGCITQGSTREEAIENIKDAILGWLHVRLMRIESTCQAAAEIEPESEAVEVEV